MRIEDEEREIVSFLVSGQRISLLVRVEEEYARETGRCGQCHLQEHTNRGTNTTRKNIPITNRSGDSSVVVGQTYPLPTEVGSHQ